MNSSFESTVALLIAALFCVIGVYIIARVVTAAYFRSKEDHDQRKQHGQTTQPRQ